MGSGQPGSEMIPVLSVPWPFFRFDIVQSPFPIRSWPLMEWNQTLQTMESVEDGQSRLVLRRWCVSPLVDHPFMAKCLAVVLSHAMEEHAVVC